MGDLTFRQFRQPLTPDEAGTLILFVEELHVIIKLVQKVGHCYGCLGPETGGTINRLSKQLAGAITEALKAQGLTVEPLGRQESLCRVLDDLAAASARAAMALRQSRRE